MMYELKIGDIIFDDDSKRWGKVTEVNEYTITYVNDLDIHYEVPRESAYPKVDDVLSPNGDALCYEIHKVELDDYDYYCPITGENFFSVECIYTAKHGSECFANVRNNYTDSKGDTYIDCWRTFDDDDEEGVVVAKVNRDKNTVEWLKTTREVISSPNVILAIAEVLNR